MKKKLPVTVFSGFLGFKTTLLNHILHNMKFKNCVIVNDMSEVNVDGISQKKTHSLGLMKN